MKTALEYFKEIAAVVNETFPQASEPERLTATIGMVGIAIHRDAVIEESQVVSEEMRKDG